MMAAFAPRPGFEMAASRAIPRRLWAILLVLAAALTCLPPATAWSDVHPVRHPVSARILPYTAVLPTATRQTVTGDGYNGTGFTVLPVLQDEPPCTAIIIHGLGGTGQEWGYLSVGMSYFSLNYVKFIIPTADNASVSYLNDEMPSWFDIRSIRGSNADVNREQLLTSVKRIDRIIDGEVRSGVAPNRIFVVGFSQGGALALTTFLRSNRNLAGCIGVATWLPLDGEYGARGNVTVSVGSGDVLMIHGTKDEAVPFEYGRLSANLIEQLGVQVKFEPIQDAPHIILSKDVIIMIEEFIKARAKGTTDFLKSLVSDLTKTFSSWTENLQLR